MKSYQKYFSACVLALLTQAAFAGGGSSSGSGSNSGSDLGAASGFSILGTTVTCTAPGTVIGDVGVGALGTFTPGTCTFVGRTPTVTDADTVAARAAFLSAYAALQPQSMSCTPMLSTITGPVTLAPGTYCTGAALTGTGVLTLDGKGDANAVWIFQIGAALAGTNFTVTMINGGQPCNVFWVPGAAVELTTSTILGNILAGAATGGSITMSGTTLVGRALANVAVTMTGTTVTGCAAQSGSPSCKKHHKHHHKGHKGDHGHDNDDNDHHDDDDDDDDGDKKKKNGNHPFNR